jgi:hypothetical protein
MNRKGGILGEILTFLQRWKVANALYHLGRHRDMKVWVPEHDLCEWIAGGDIWKDSAWGPTPFLRNWRYKFWYFFFRVKNHEQLYQKIGNVIYDCEHIEPSWIRRTKGDHLCLSPKGNEVYAISYLWLTSNPSRAIWTGVLIGLLIWFATWRIERIMPSTPQKIQVEYVNGPNATVHQSTN